MHRDLADPTKLTDSMRMFRLGYEGGKPKKGQTGAQPEWFYKGDGSILAPPEGELASPTFALDGGEEPEIVGIYVIDNAGDPIRVGFALGNEFSDHVTERENYLWLAHSKLRPASLGPELLVGELPLDVQGVSRIRRGRNVIWERAFSVRRTEHGALDRKSRSSPFQVQIVPAPGRHSHTLFRDGNPFVQRGREDAERRRV